MDEAAKARAKARGNWQGRRLTLAESDDQDLSMLSVSARFAELFALSQRAHELSGRPWPTYSRADMPGRCRLLTDDD